MILDEEPAAHAVEEGGEGHAVERAGGHDHQARARGQLRAQGSEQDLVEPRARGRGSGGATGREVVRETPNEAIEGGTVAGHLPEADAVMRRKAPGEETVR